MTKIKNLTLILVSIILGIIIVEITYNYLFRDNFVGSQLDRVSFYKNYSSSELDRTLPIRHKYNGGECIKRGLMTKSNKMNWHPRYGANDNEVNIECVNKMFLESTLKRTNI